MAKVKSSSELIQYTERENVITDYQKHLTSLNASRPLTRAAEHLLGWKTTPDIVWEPIFETTNLLPDQQGSGGRNGVFNAKSRESICLF